MQEIIAYYDSLAEEEALGEDAADFKPDGQTLMLIPATLAPAVEALLAGRHALPSPPS